MTKMRGSVWIPTTSQYTSRASRHGTWVNNQRLEGPVVLQEGDVVQLGGGSGPCAEEGAENEDYDPCLGHGGPLL